MIGSWRCAVAGLLVFAAQAVAQTTIPTINIMYQQPVTTGMVGFTNSQTARLSVLNLVPATAVPSVCNVQLAFYDDKNNLLKQASVNALPPQTASSLDLSRTEVASSSPTVQRAQIRGVVRTGPLIPASAQSVATPGASVVFASACTVMTTLEIFDTATGVTQVLTSDTRPVSPAAVIPLATALTQQ
ncbi:MAG: hypothetical protein ABSC23_01060 [Bryobacteraceae bacterium]|jgi:hypothetical protein